MTFNTPHGQVRMAGAPDSWGVWFADDPQQPHWRTFLDEVVEAGYKAIELGPWGYLPTDEAALRAELDARGLDLVGVTVMQPLADASNWPALEAEVRAAATLGSKFGVEHLVLIDGMYSIVKGPDGARTVPSVSAAGWQQIVDSAARVAEWVSREWGMTVVFHPHADTFVANEEDAERLLAAVPAEHMKLCLDTGHHVYAGGDPVAFYAKHADRIGHVHLKDADPRVLAEVREGTLDLAEAVSRGVMVEPGKGTIDFGALREALRAGGYEGWAVVEQDIYPASLGTPLPLAIRSVAHLTAAGFEL